VKVFASAVAQNKAVRMKIEVTTRVGRAMTHLVESIQGAANRMPRTAFTSH
jgi:hypothetical protein